MGNSKKSHKSGSAKRKKKEKDLLRKEAQNPNQKKLNFVKSNVNALKQYNEKIQVNTVEDIENVDTITTVGTCSNIDNGDSDLKKYYSTVIENEREKLNSDDDVNALKQDNEKIQVNTVEDIENVDTMTILLTMIQ
ncbi:uncharacterized protein LOC111038474 [Myzus persicae]|uniref:uncharacterized protein LOC111038474 n=1 Tax=Myzus persicae TaxID=13164 RepID=UPI000B930A62|nr:uncharacterized protein LOC111038474 [Myzus persicae]